MPPKRNQVRNKKPKEKEEKGRGKEHGKGKDKEKDETKGEQYLEDIINVDESPAKDFELLVNAPISEDDHFVFQSEKNWSVDVSKYSEFFTLDLKVLSAAIESIPFNENVNINNKYFTDDQLTDIYNTAEQGKKKYNDILSSLETKAPSDARNNIGESTDSLEDTTEDLEFLLSLQEPVNSPLLTVKSLPPSYNSDAKISTSKSNTSTKPLDLEKWLDSILDD